MRRYVIRRLLQAVLIMVGVTVITFGLMVLAPGDPITLLVSPEDADPDMRWATRGLS